MLYGLMEGPMAKTKTDGRSCGENTRVRIVAAEEFVPGWRKNPTVSNQTPGDPN